MKTKKCTGGNYNCGRYKKISYFPRRSGTGRYRNQCKECINKYKRKYREINKQIILNNEKQYRIENCDRLAKIKKRYNEKTVEKRSKYSKMYRLKNAEKIAARKREKRRQCINTRLRESLRSRLVLAIKFGQKSGSAVKDLGCSIEELKKYLENKFYTNAYTNQNMTWGNYGLHGWHIDHIKPLVSFDLADRKQFVIACHYTNLQPLWANDNYKKGCKL